MISKNDVLVIGLGNCGSKIASGFQDRGYETMYANGSTQDLKVLGSRTGVYKLDGFDGFGGDRSKAMDCLLANEEFTDALEHIKQAIVIITYAAGGSTGSGLSYIIAQHLYELYDGEKVIVNVPVLPSDGEDINKHRNAYNCLKDLSELEGMGCTIVLDNNKSKTNDLRWVNETFLDLMDGFITYDSWGEQNNFDSAEKLNMLKDEGSMIIDCPRAVKRNETDCNGMKRIATDCNGMKRIAMEYNPIASVQNDMICSNIALIIGDGDQVNKDDVIAEFGKPLNVYQGYGSDKTMIAVSGLTLPFDTIKHLGQLAKEGQAERKRNAAQAQMNSLDDLDFDDTVEKKPRKDTEKSSKKPSVSSLMALKKKKS